MDGSMDLAVRHRRELRNAVAGGSAATQIAFLDDALVRLAHALDAILRLAAVVRKRADDLELGIGSGAQPASHETHGLSGAELSTHVYLGFRFRNMLRKPVCTGGAGSSQAEMTARLDALRVAWRTRPADVRPRG